jgi:hypothetical protein
MCQCFCITKTQVQHLRAAFRLFDLSVILIAMPCLSHDIFISAESADMLKGAIELDAKATVKRTKNVRDGFEYCIRVDAPNASTPSLSLPRQGVKRWTKLVMCLRTEGELVGWINALRWALVHNAAAAAAQSDAHDDGGSSLL